MKMYSVCDTSVIHNSIKKDVLRGKLGRRQGPPNINKLKQNEVVLSLKVSLLIQIIQNKKILYLVC